jgi:alpha-beta hydrolase superfamily lysophospholipase
MTPIEMDTPPARPRYIETGGGFLFAWHHPPRPAERRAAAVVLCPPLASDYVRAYPVWRILAERLAHEGFDVLRFDYEGTGDSSGDLHDADRVSAWIGDIGRVTAEARTLCSSHDVTLIGLRTGATLALHAAAGSGATRLVLWSPFRSGREYVRELKALSRLSHKDYVTTADRGNDILADGYVLPGHVVRDMDMLAIDGIANMPPADILLLDRDDRPASPAVAERLEQIGCRVTRACAVGTATMLQQPALGVLPEQTLDTIVGWLTSRADAAKLSGVGVTAGARRRGEEKNLPRLASHGRRFTEQGIHFGSGGRLFGMLTIPERDSRAPAVILLNTGLEYRVGPHRLYVPLARELATLGHVVFRYDLGGIGDSTPPAGVQGQVAYPPHALDNTREAIEFVKTRAPGRAVIVAGLCSGGWHAFRAANDGLGVDGIVAINPPMYLRATRSWNRQLSGDYDRMRHCRRQLRTRDVRRHPLRRAVAHARFLAAAAIYAIRQYGDRLRASVARWRPDGLARDLMRIDARRIECLFVFSSGDAGLDYFEQHAGHLLRRHKVRHVAQLTVEGAGHTFSPPEAQDTLRDVLVEFASQHALRVSRHERGAALPANHGRRRWPSRGGSHGGDLHEDALRTT